MEADPHPSELIVPLLYTFYAQVRKISDEGVTEDLSRSAGSMMLTSSVADNFSEANIRTCVGTKSRAALSEKCPEGLKNALIAVLASGLAMNGFSLAMRLLLATASSAGLILEGAGQEDRFWIGLM
ncbi:hypothetical protein M8818_006377 [Zalaria obscura]|uniref:Uncharacterized protein n=1 Tax=Zalaria obscura TaxID=2024903 RepID=A0ACC3S621_9PEZI